MADSKMCILNGGSLETITVCVKKNPKNLSEVFAHLHQGKFDLKVRTNRISLEAKHLHGIGQKAEAVMSGALEFATVKEGPYPAFLEKVRSGPAVLQLNIGGPRCGYENPLSCIQFTAEGVKEFLSVAQWMRSRIQELKADRENTAQKVAESKDFTKAADVGTGNTAELKKAEEKDKGSKRTKRVAKPGKKNIRLSQSPPAKKGRKLLPGGSPSSSFPRLDSEENLPTEDDIEALIKYCQDLPAGEVHKMLSNTEITE